MYTTLHTINDMAIRDSSLLFNGWISTHMRAKIYLLRPTVGAVECMYILTSNGLTLGLHKLTQLTGWGR